MESAEKLTVKVSIQPGAKGLENFFSSPFGIQGFKGLVLSEAVVIKVKTLVEAEPGVDGKRADKSRCLQTVFFITSARVVNSGGR